VALNIGSVKLPITEATTAAKSAATAADQKSAKQIRQSLALKKAAEEFESQLLSSLWKSMQGTIESPDDSSDPAAGNIQDLQIQALCSGMANGGGIGIAKMITKHLESAASTDKSEQSQQTHRVKP